MVATLTFLPFILSGSITTLTSLDFLGFGLPPGSPSLGELLSRGQERTCRRRGSASPPSSCWAVHADAADLHRRGGARRVRSAEDRLMTMTYCSRSRPHRVVQTRRPYASPPSRTCPSTSTAARRWPWSARSGSGKSVTALSMLQLLPYPTASHGPGSSISLDGQELVGAPARRCARCAATASPWCSRSR